MVDFMFGLNVHTNWTNHFFSFRFSDILSDTLETFLKKIAIDLLLEFWLHCKTQKKDEMERAASHNQFAQMFK